MIYEPSDDSFLLQKYVKKFAKGRVLDLGCGSGIQALTALENTKDVIASDISKDAVEFCKKKGVNAIYSDLFSNINDKFDLIIFNPPYLPKDEVDKEFSLALSGGEKGNELVERFLKDAKKYLRKDGKILIVFSSLTPNVLKLFKKYDYKFKKLEQLKYFFERIYVYIIY
ncbi:MAG TPA: HemK2/MTQ2 family protein methyltransferase [Candidatus Nanoarchaeia archaeon]|nr:HemK2/MTQ2 family protein methyltransferase [Candidatus Nanoarchaeia archaeon]